MASPGNNKGFELASDKRSRLRCRGTVPSCVNYCSRNQRSVRLKSTKSRDSDKKSRRYYDGGDTVSARVFLLFSRSLPRSVRVLLLSRSFSLSRRETDGGLYYADSYYHQLNSYTTSGPWCSYVILGDARRWYLVHEILYRVIEKLVLVESIKIYKPRYNYIAMLLS